jgi:Tn3 transposase DDE domain
LPHAILLSECDNERIKVPKNLQPTAAPSLTSIRENCACEPKPSNRSGTKYSRLIANAVIYYNVAISSRVLEQRPAAGDQKAVKILMGILPVA